jgi:hypothetical protein
VVAFNRGCSRELTAHSGSQNASLRARVEERFSAEAMVAGYERIYQQVLASGDGASRVLGT